MCNLQMKITEYAYKQSTCYGNLERHKGEYDFTHGTVTTPHGIVDCYAQGNDKERHSTWLRFVYQGYVYHRAFSGKRYTHRGIVTKARQFVNEVIAGNV
jgi:hypothetical protein